MIIDTVVSLCASHPGVAAKVIGCGGMHIDRGAEAGSEENGDAERLLRSRTASPLDSHPRANNLCAGAND